MLHKGLTVVAALLLALLLSGCNILGLDVEAQLRPPRLAGEQQEIQRALEAYIDKTADKASAGRYLLKYPKAGEYRSAFVRQDIDGDGQEEAIAFYCPTSKSPKTHINYLKKVDGEWTSVHDIPGIGIDIDRVSFGDLNGDGVKELFTGWDLYNSRDRQLVMYSLNGGQLNEQFTDTYTSVIVGNVTARGHDDLLLFRIDSTNNAVTARLFSYADGHMTELASAELDGYIRSFGTSHIAPLADGVNGVYIDGYKDGNTTVTELLYWDGSRLVTPFALLEGGNANVSAREALRETSLPSMDIDVDGQIEWPRMRRLTGYETTDVENTLWLTEWCSWDYAARKVVREFASVVNMADGYYLMMDDAWVDKTAGDRITARYTADTRTLELLEVQNGVVGDPVLALRTVATGASAYALNTVDYTFQPLLTNAATEVQVWFDPREPFAFSMEKIRYLLLAMPQR